MGPQMQQGDAPPGGERQRDLAGSIVECAQGGGGDLRIGNVEEDRQRDPHLHYDAARGDHIERRAGAQPGQQAQQAEAGGAKRQRFADGDRDGHGSRLAFPNRVPDRQGREIGGDQISAIGGAGQTHPLGATKPEHAFALWNVGGQELVEVDEFHISGSERSGVA